MKSQANDVFPFGSLSNAGKMSFFCRVASFLSRSVRANKQSQATQLHKHNKTERLTNARGTFGERSSYAQVFARKRVELKKNKK